MQRMTILLALVLILPSGCQSADQNTGKVAELTTMGLHYYNPSTLKPRIQTLSTDVCIYGGTSAGVAAALQLSRMGKKVVILEPSSHLGGMSSGGLSATDIGNKKAIGGIAREFYSRVGKRYGVTEEWDFEPHVAKQVFTEMAQEAQAPVYYHQFLKSVETQKTPSGTRLVSAAMESGLTVRAQMFIDATYEGDLMAKAGVKYRVGRESNDTYKETLNGVQVSRLHQFDLPVDPYVTQGKPASGLLPGINTGEIGTTGEGDRRIQAYNFRLCLTKDAGNRIPFEKPAGYNPQEYVLLARYLAKGWPEKEVFRKFDPIQGNKVDKNNHGAISTDYVGRNYDYPEADYAAREKIFQAHVTYQKGLMWFLGNDPSVPENIRTKWSQWGLCKDEFQETGGWPFQLYIREARRMISDYVVTEHNCRSQVVAPDSVGLAAYAMDSHNVQRFVKEGRVLNEGDVQQKGLAPYAISYRSIIPRQAECENLVVPVCLSASHIAYGSIRMEPVFMLLGQSGATAAALCLDEKIPLQKLSYAKLRARLLADHQVLQWQTGSATPAQVQEPRVVAATEPQSRFVQQLEAGKPQHIVVYGTSLTAAGAWVPQMQKALSNAYPGLVKLTNSGGSGMNSQWGVENLQARVLDKKPDAVFIEFATNDAVTRFNLSLEQAKKNLETMINGIQQAAPQCEIILQVMSPVIDHPAGTPGYRPELARYQQIYRDVAKQRSLLLIDHAPAWKALLDGGEDKFRAFAPDGVHPNAAGYEKFVTPTILRVLGVRKGTPTLAGIIVDDAQGKKSGPWVDSTRNDFRLGTGSIHDDNAHKGEVSIVLEPEVPKAGEYEIFFVFMPFKNRATNVPVTVSIAGKEAKSITVNQKLSEGDGLFSLGRFQLPEGKSTAVTISNQGTNGYVAVDGIRVVPVQ